LKETAELAQKVAAAGSADLAASAVEIAGVRILAAQVAGGTAALMPTLDTLRSRLGSAVILLAAVDDGQVSLVAGVSKDIVARIKAGELVNLVGKEVGARGGGKPELARAGGGDRVDAIGAALKLVVPFVRERLTQGASA